MAHCWLLRFAGLFCTGILAGIASAQPAPKADLYVLSVGIEAQLTARGKLDIYAQDAAFVAEAMSTAKPLFRKFEPQVVNGKDATRANVLASLDRLRTKVRAQDTAVVFFSSHGSFEEGKYFIWLAKGGPKGNDQWITGDELLAALKAVPGKVIVLLDTCCAGAALPKQPKDAPNVAYITACRRAESSYGQSDSKTKPHGYFVISACEAMKGLADEDQNGSITVAELEKYIVKRSNALCAEQHAVTRVPSTLAGFTLTAVPDKAKLTTLYDEPGKRNPFGQPDIDKPFGDDVRTFAMKIRTPGSEDDANATAWNKRGATGKPDSLDGEWEYRWKGGTAGNEWVVGSALIRIVNDRIFILCRDKTSKYMIEARKMPNDRIVGRYVNVNDPEDTSPFVSKLVNPERIDGYWSDGRWDLRRVATSK